MMTPDDLLAFEEDIAQEFGAGNIKAPIHLSKGNERQLIDIFKGIHHEDWVLASWRSHPHCLLKGVPAAQLKAKIMSGHSVSLTFPEYRVLCSGIVGGIAPIACGLGHVVKQKNDANPMGHTSRVWCFVGDMTASTGIFRESLQYATGHELPVTWVIEDNGKSVCSDTKETWGDGMSMYLTRYEYELGRPHAGTGQWVRF